MKSLSFISSINPSEEEETSRRHTGHAIDLGSSAKEEEEEEEEEEDSDDDDFGAVFRLLEGGADVFFFFFFLFLVLFFCLPLFEPTVWSGISSWSEAEEGTENRASRQREQKE